MPTSAPALGVAKGQAAHSPRAVAAQRTPHHGMWLPAVDVRRPLGDLLPACKRHGGDLGLVSGPGSCVARRWTKPKGLQLDKQLAGLWAPLSWRVGAALGLGTGLGTKGQRWPGHEAAG